MSGLPNSFQFLQAIESGDFEAARGLAARMPHITLGEALSLTLLSAEKAPDSYEELARDWLRRFALEQGARANDPEGLQIAAQVLAGAGEGSIAPAEARRAIHELMRPPPSAGNDQRPTILLASAALFLAAGLVAALVLLFAQ